MAAASPIFGSPSLALALAVCAVGYVLPSMALARMAKARQHRMRLSLPDALDLLVVSVEAGLGLDQALQRVSEELAFAHPDLCDELRLINLELRAGTARSDALHNLAKRTMLDDLQSLVTMLVQTDKFGTSVSQSLRVHSESLRTKRRQRAEEAAAKTGAKMVFPLVICIFPAIWVVTLGPAVIKFIQVLFAHVEAVMTTTINDPPSLDDIPNPAAAPPVPTTLEEDGLERGSRRAAADQDAVYRRGDRSGRRRSHAAAVRAAGAARRARAGRAAGRGPRHDRFGSRPAIDTR